MGLTGFAGPLAGLTVATGIVLALTGCGTPAPDMPAAFGPDGKCYYVQSPTEVVNLKNQGHCPKNAVAVQAPASWVIYYYPVYNSAWYRTNVVPPSARDSYGTYMTGFGKTYSTEIEDDAPKAKYVDDNGDIVSGKTAGVSGDGDSITEHGGFLGGSGGDGGGGDGGHGSSGGDRGGGGHGGGGE